MIFGGASAASVDLGSVLHDPGTIVDQTALRPLVVEWNGRDCRQYILMDSFSKDDTLGQSVTATVTFINPADFEPIAGDTIRVRYHSSVEFAGTINNVRKQTDDLQNVRYVCDLIDWSQTLLRRLIRRNFSNMTVQGIVDSVLDNELAGEVLTVGSIDSTVTVPLVDASSHVRVFDLFRDLAAATGQSFRVDFDQSLRFQSTTVDEAPLVLNESNVLLESTEIARDRETYRNVQTIIATGTPGENEDALSVTVERTNADQIAERLAIEGGTGRYEELEEITHPTSNRLDDLVILASGYGDLRLSTSGTLRTILTLQARGYGFRAGQVATVDLPTFGIAGEFLIQRVSLTERAGQFLFHTLELTQSSAQRRAYESWLAILGKGKIAIQLFSSLVHSSVTFTTPGAANWTVPVGVTVVTITAIGASAGGGGGSGWTQAIGHCSAGDGAYGGKGGNGGKVISSVMVVEGEELNIFIGSKGVKGNGGYQYQAPCSGGSPMPTNGTDATDTTVFRDGISLAEAYGGDKGKISPAYHSNGPAGNPGGGSGGIVTVGGGKVGGAGGAPGSGHGNGSNGVDGQNGEVMIEW